MGRGRQADWDLRCRWAGRLEDMILGMSTSIRAVLEPGTGCQGTTKER